MSEQRRATLTPFGKSDKKSNKSPRQTFRLLFTLSDPNENSCPVFDYATAVKSEERKLLKKHREEKDKKPNGFVDPFEDDDEDVKRLARKFEAKYGDKKKLKSYAELGAGYDETDPFIDNTDANDEALQEDQETPCGGYYINSGPLELKRVEVSDHSDADEVKKRGRKRALAVIDEEEDDEEEEKEDGGEAECEEEGADVAGEDVESKPVIEDADPKKTKLLEERPEPEKPPTPSYNGKDEGPPIKKKKKRVIEEDNADGVSAKTKKSKTVKALLEEKRIQEQPTRISEEPKRQTASATSIVEAIESVVNAGNNEDENSNSSNSVHSAGTVSSSVSDESQDGQPGCENPPPPLPDNLSPEVMTLVDHIKRTAAVTDNTSKTFCADINHSLIKLEWKTREFTAGSRNMLFAHLACHLPCTKSTLMRRAKKLFINKEESQIENLICKLKATIDATMPSLLEQYGIECQRIAEEQGLPSGDVNTPGEENHQPSGSTSAKTPKRRFEWTDETRGYLQSITTCKKKCYKVTKPRKSSWEDYIKGFLHSVIRPLWPSGWMKNSILIKQINRLPISGKSKHSSHHSPSKAESSRLNVSVSFSSPTSSNVSLYISPSGETPQHTKSSTTGTTPLAAKTGADPINLLTKITSSYNTPPSQPKKSHLSNHHHNVKPEKPETFSMDSLLKRTSDGANCNDFNTTLSDLMKNEGVIINGASLPLKNVNSSQKNDSSRSENILDLSSCNNSVSITPSVIQSAAPIERTPARTSDSVSVRLNSAEKLHNHSTSSCAKEAMSNVPLNRKQRLLQVNFQTDTHSETVSDVSVIKKTDCVVRSQSQAAEKTSKSCGGGLSDGPPPREREVDKETTTATDILSQIISESLRSPPQQPYTPAKTKEDMKSQGVHKDQELLYDVMQDLKELNHLSSGGARETKNTSFTGASWSYPVKSSECSKSTPYHNEFLKHLSVYNTKDTSVVTSTPTPPPYSRHSSSSYDNSAYVSEVNKSMYSHPSHRTSQSLTAHTSSPSSKVAQINQMKNHPNAGISSGLPHRYMGQMDYNSEDPHLMGLASSLQYSLTGWPYPGSESQSHQ